MVQKNGLMEQFDKLSKINRAYLVKRFDEKKVDQWITKARQDYETVIPQIPYIGGEGHKFTQLLLITSTFIPLLKILRAEGISTRDNGHLIVTTADEYYQSIPWPITWFMRRSYFTDSGIERRKAFAQRVQQRRYPDDWVFKFVPGDGKTFAFGMDYSECGLKKFYSRQGLEEFVPYLCLCDYSMWKAIGIEGTRTQTLANGGSKCDFRIIKKGPNAKSLWPPESHQEWTGKFEK